MDSAEPVELIIGCLEDPAVSVRLYDRFFPEEYGVGFSAEAQADGLHASVGPVEYGSGMMPIFPASWQGWLRTSAAGPENAPGKPTT